MTVTRTAMRLVNLENTGKFHWFDNSTLLRLKIHKTCDIKG
ncbi:MAG: hypothetical protein ACI8VW_001893, partial [bacterium]